MAHRSRFSGAAENYEENRRLETPDMGYIYGQAVCPPFLLGKKRFSGVGCEIAAVYNALRLLGQDVSLSEILRSFEEAGYVMRGFVPGDMGTDPFSLGEFLDRRGVKNVSYTNYDALLSVVAEYRFSLQVYILSFWNRNTVSGGVHTVAAYTSPDDGRLHILNRYNNSTGESAEDLLPDYVSRSRFLVGYRLLA